MPGTELDVVLTDEVLTLGNAIDADGTVGPERIPMRLCGVHVPERGYCFYLTNLARSLGPWQVADIYRVRWESELNNKLDKSSHRLDEFDARTPAAVHALIHATIIASVLVGLIVHCHNLAIAQTSSTTRTQPPLHHGLVARLLATCAFRIADALTSTGRRPTSRGSISPPLLSMLVKTQLATQAVHSRPIPRLEHSALFPAPQIHPGQASLTDQVWLFRYGRGRRVYQPRAAR